MHVTRRHRQDGIVELSPKLAPLAPADRLLVIVTVLLAANGLFVCGAIPAPVAAAIAVSCLAGEVVLGLKAVVLLALRPAAEVHEVPRWGSRR
jgi:hypothetical protein